MSEVSGILIFDKPIGFSSAKLISCLKKKCNFRRIGHCGTLDPFATGVLVCCINKATKLSYFLLKGEKKYKVAIKLGFETDTGDVTGNVISTSVVKQYTSKYLNDIIMGFEGETKQIPPAFSALKSNGVPLYKHARKGNLIQKPARKIVISYIKDIKVDLPIVSFEICCSSGTYIRSLASDIGKKLGCGAYVESLRRIESCGFSINQSLAWSEFSNNSDSVFNKVLNMSNALNNLPSYIADKQIIEKIKYGRQLNKEEVLVNKQNESNYIKIVDQNNTLLAILDCTTKNNRYNYFNVFI